MNDASKSLGQAMSRNSDQGQRTDGEENTETEYCQTGSEDHHAGKRVHKQCDYAENNSSDGCNEH